MAHQDYGIQEALSKLGIKDTNQGVSTGTQWYEAQGSMVDRTSPADGKVIASVKQASKEDYEKVIEKAQDAFTHWRLMPAPQRGEIVRQMGLALRENKEYLGRLVSYEMGKIYQEGLGEVQEMIDIADFALGQSRMMYGMNSHSERPEHHLSERYHPLGIVGIVTAFNFPVAVWAWNTMNALIAGDVVVWKPSGKGYLCAIAVHNLMQQVLKDNNLPEGIINLTAGRDRKSVV